MGNCSKSVIFATALRWTSIFHPGGIFILCDGQISATILWFLRDGLRARFLFVGYIVMDVVRLVESTLAGMGYEMVDLEISGRGLMRVFMDKAGGIALDDCERVSNQLTRLFAVEGVDYERLEVSSPGLDRPLKKEADFARFRGEKVNLKLRMPLDGRKNFVGILGEVQDGVLQLDREGKLVAIQLSNVDKARLVPTF